jgi:hypothetical protein
MFVLYIVVVGNIRGTCPPVQYNENEPFLLSHSPIWWGVLESLRR